MMGSISLAFGQAGCIVGEDYPKPIVDHKTASKWCIEQMSKAYKANKTGDEEEILQSSDYKYVFICTMFFLSLYIYIHIHIYMYTYFSVHLENKMCNATRLIVLSWIQQVSTRAEP